MGAGWYSGQVSLHSGVVSTSHATPCWPHLCLSLSHSARISSSHTLRAWLTVSQTVCAPSVFPLHLPRSPPDSTPLFIHAVSLHNKPLSALLDPIQTDSRNSRQQGGRDRGRSSFHTGIHPAPYLLVRIAVVPLNTRPTQCMLTLKPLGGEAPEGRQRTSQASLAVGSLGGRENMP